MSTPRPHLIQILSDEHMGFPDKMPVNATMHPSNPKTD